MTSESVARVLASKHPGYAEGDIVVAVTGWRMHALSEGIGDGLIAASNRKMQS